MYRKKSKGWYKHKDFIFMDLCCILLAFILADWFRNGTITNLYINQLYRNAIIFIGLLDLCISVIFESYKGVLKRGYYLEFRAVLKQMILIELGTGLYLFSVDWWTQFLQNCFIPHGHYLHRTYIILIRILRKKYLKSKMKEEGEISLYIVTTRNIAEDVIRNVKENNYNLYNINGLVIVDQDLTDQEISGIPVVAGLKNASSYICQHG